MTLPRPPWECRSPHDKRKFKAWLNQQLNTEQFDTPTADDIWREAQNDDAFHAAMAREYGQQLQRGPRNLQRRRVLLAVRNRDLQALQQLTANDPELANLALQELTRHRKRGREPGEPRPRDLSDMERVVRQDALVELDRIRLIMMHYYGRYKGSDATAIEVVAERAGISPDGLISARKNRPRHSAS